MHARPPQPSFLRARLAPMALLGLLAACGPEGAPAERGLERLELPRVRAEPVAQREMLRSLSTTTVVRSQREVQVLPQASGVVIAILAEEGDRVEEGAVLARLDARDAQAAVREARVALREAENAVTQARIAQREAEAALVNSQLAADQARRNFERNEKTGLISEQELDTLRLARATAEQDLVAVRLQIERRTHDLLAAETSQERAAVLLERSELALSHTELRAPFAGRIAERRVSAGDTVGGSTALFVLVDPDDLVAVLHRPQRELALFLGRGPANGGGVPEDGDGELAARPMEIHATAEALPGRRFPGRLLRLSPGIDPESGSFRVTVRLLPDEHGVQPLPGMLVRLSVVTERRPDALVVPKQAVQREGDALILWRVEDGRVRRVPVEEGFSSDDELEVRPLRGARLAPGDPIVVVGSRDLEDGDAVEVVADGGARLGSGAPSDAEPAHGGGP